jgi:hypothetical protein
MKRLIPAAALAALALAGCSQASSPAASSPAASSPAASPAAPSPSPSPASTARLTRRQAARAYTAIVDPANRLGDAVNQDYTDRAPLAQYRRDSRAYIASLRVMSARLSAVRWPARVEPYVRAMVATDVVADIRCEQDLLKARSYAQADTINYTSQDCTEAASNGSNPSTIRSLLGLPPPQ